MGLVETAYSQDVDGLIGLAKAYFDAAYMMDAEKFAAIFDPSASVTRRDDNGDVVVTPIATWLEIVRGMPSPHDAGSMRDDEILSVVITRELAMLKLRLRIPPREVTDLLSCLYLNGRWQIVQKVFAAEMRS
ncbi:MAG TPA: nuclear transport factor 2 family protein [Sphingomonas sp.]|nr:nuclear transport factor 2 family protein [Sphingomonas sp.]